MNIRNRCTKVCLFLWVLGMCFAAHPLHAQSVIPVPLKIEQGTGSFLLSEKTKLYTEALEKGAITQDEFNYAMEHLSDSSSELDSRLDVIDGRTVAYGDATGIAATSIADCAEKMEGYSQAIEENQKTIDKCSEEQERYAKSAENITKG